MNSGLDRKTCPYCQTGFTSVASVVVCPSCRVPHHEDCWRENSGCTTYGCNGQPQAHAVPSALSRPGQTNMPADHIDLTLDDLSVCSACGGAISVWADRCPSCGSSNDVVSVPSHASYPGGQSAYTGYPSYPREFKSAAVACLLNLLFVGVGYFYLGQVGKGLAFLFGSLLFGACTGGFGYLILLIIAMVDCAESAKRMNTMGRM